MARELKVQIDQTIYDLAIQAYGSVEGVFLLMKDNPNLNLMDAPVPGEKVYVRDESLNAEVENYVMVKKVVPANVVNTKATPNTGFDYELDFALG